MIFVNLNKKKQNKFFNLSFDILFYFQLYLQAKDRLLKLFLGVLIFIAIIKNIKIKTKILLFSILISTAILTVISSDYLKNRYVDRFITLLTKIQKIYKIAYIIDYINQI